MSEEWIVAVVEGVRITAQAADASYMISEVVVYQSVHCIGNRSGVPRYRCCCGSFDNRVLF